MCDTDELYVRLGWDNVLHGLILCVARMSFMCCTDGFYVRHRWVYVLHGWAYVRFGWVVLHGWVLCAARISCMCCTDELYVRLGWVISAARTSYMCGSDELYLRHGWVVCAALYIWRQQVFFFSSVTWVPVYPAAQLRIPQGCGFYSHLSEQPSSRGRRSSGNKYE
jgi:hypothetical protein